MSKYQDGVYEDLLEHFAMIFEYDNIDTTYSPDSSPAVIENKFKLCLTSHNRDRRYPLHFAISQGNLYMAKRIVECKPKLVTPDALICAINNSEAEIVEWLLSLDTSNMKEESANMHSGYSRPWCKVFVKATTTAENIKRFSSIASEMGWGFTFDVEAVQCSAPHLVSPILDLLPQHPELTKCLLSIAVENDDLDLFQAAISRDPEEILERNIDIAMLLGQRGQTPMIAIAFPLFEAYTTHRFFVELIKSCRLSILMQLRERGILCPWYINEIVIEKTNVEFISWFFSVTEGSAVIEDCPLVVGDLEVAKLIRKLGVPLSAIRPQSVDVANFLISQGADMTECLDFAVGIVYKDKDQWNMHVHENQFFGYQFEYQGNLDVVVTIRDKCPHIPFLPKHFLSAAKTGSIDVLQYLSDKICGGAPFVEAMKIGLQYHHLSVVSYLHEEKGVVLAKDGLFLALQHGPKENELFDYLLSKDVTDWTANPFPLQEGCSIDFQRSCSSACCSDFEGCTAKVCCFTLLKSAIQRS